MRRQAEIRLCSRLWRKTGVVLSHIDKNWKEHLKSMDDLKQSVQGAVYEQKDPLLIYKFESFNLFSTMLEDINSSIISFLFRANLPNRDPKDLKRAAVEKNIQGTTSRGKEEVLPTNKRNNNANQQQLSRRQRRAQERKMRRN